MHVGAWKMTRCRLVRVFALVTGVLLVVSCRRHDLRTVRIDVPEMHNEACAELVKKALSRVENVKYAKTEVDLEKRRVIVTYESLKLSLKNVEFAIAKAGFDANDIPADPKALKALPPECAPE